MSSLIFLLYTSLLPSQITLYWHDLICIELNVEINGPIPPKTHRRKRLYTKARIYLAVRLLWITENLSPSKDVQSTAENMEEEMLDTVREIEILPILAIRTGTEEPEMIHILLEIVNIIGKMKEGIEKEIWIEEEMGEAEVEAGIEIDSGIFIGTGIGIGTGRGLMKITVHLRHQCYPRLPAVVLSHRKS